MGGSPSQSYSPFGCAATPKVAHRARRSFALVPSAGPRRPPPRAVLNTRRAANRHLGGWRAFLRPVQPSSSDSMTSARRQTIFDRPSRQSCQSCQSAHLLSPSSARDLPCRPSCGVAAGCAKCSKYQQKETFSSPQFPRLAFTPRRLPLGRSAPGARPRGSDAGSCPGRTKDFGLRIASLLRSRSFQPHPPDTFTPRPSRTFRRPPHRAAAGAQTNKQACS